MRKRAAEKKTCCWLEARECAPTSMNPRIYESLLIILLMLDECRVGLIFDARGVIDFVAPGGGLDRLFALRIL